MASQIPSAVLPIPQKAPKRRWVDPAQWHLAILPPPVQLVDGAVPLGPPLQPLAPPLQMVVDAVPLGPPTSWPASSSSSSLGPPTSWPASSSSPSLGTLASAAAVGSAVGSADELGPSACAADDVCGVRGDWWEDTPGGDLCGDQSIRGKLGASTPWRILRRSIRGKLGGINTLGNFAEINPRKTGGINTLEKNFGGINPPKRGGINTL